MQESLNRLRLFILKRSCRSSPVPLGWPWRRKAPFDDDGGRPSTGDGRRCRFATNAAESSTLDAHRCTADEHTGTPQGKHQHRQGGHGPGDCDEAAGERYGPGEARRDWLQVSSTFTPLSSNGACTRVRALFLSDWHAAPKHMEDREVVHEAAKLNGYAPERRCQTQGGP